MKGADQILNTGKFIIIYKNEYVHKNVYIIVTGMGGKMFHPYYIVLWGG